MDATIRSLFLDCFRSADLEPEVKQLAAQGLLAPRAHDQLGILMWLCDDADPAIARTAGETIARLPRANVSAFLARADVPEAMRLFFTARGVAPAAEASNEPDPGPFALGDQAEPAVSSESAATDEPGPAEVQEAHQASVMERIAKMTVPEKLTLAMKGSREERGVLIRDSNKLVSTAVITSPKLTESEVESIARMANVSDEILRIIATNRAWIKNYSVVSALAKNPKTPVALSMNLLPRLHEKDLKALSTNRNIPDVIRMSARTRLVFEKR
jgi:hypothetical protein